MCVCEQTQEGHYPPEQLREDRLPRPFRYDKRVGGFPVYWEQSVSRAQAVGHILFALNGHYLDHQTSDVEITFTTVNEQKKQV